MLGKLFSRLKKTAAAKPAEKKPALQTPVAQSPQAHANPVKVLKPSAQELVDQLTQGRAIDTLDDHDILNQLLKHSEQLDKRTNKLVRERLRILREQEKAEKARREQQEKFCARLETLARLQHHPLYESEFRHLHTQWQTLTQSDADLQQRADRAIKQCEQQIAAAEQARAEQIAREHIIREQQAERDALQQAQRAEAETAAQAAQEQQEHQKVLQDQQKQQSEQQKQKNIQRQQAIEKKLQELLTQMETSLSEADSKQARSLQDRIRDTMKQLPPRGAHQYEGRLHLLHGQLRELQDWQDYAALPKLEALCEAMEKLVTAGLPVAQQIEAVRELQQQWRAMKPPPSPPVHALWERFKQAGDAAWLPCADHLAQERQQRAFNREQREAICSALEQFSAQQDWTRADWKAVGRIIDKARQEFHQFHPVERHDEKPLRARFDAALQPVNAQLLQHQQHNESLKQQLIDHAAALHDMIDKGKATERVKQLQADWKLIGAGRRQQDQQLWQQFQQHCNAVFDQRRAQHQQQLQTQADQVEHAQQICAQIAALATLDDSGLTQSSEQFEQLRAQFRAIADIPEKQQAALKKQFHSACDRYRTQLAGISKRQHSRQLQQLAQLAQLCEQLENTQDNAVIETLCAQWQPQGLPADWLTGISRRYQQAIAFARGEHTADVMANEQQLRQLCIEMEILADTETPEEDRTQRREFQMQALTRGLGQAAAVNAGEQAEKLLVSWYCSASADPAIQPALAARFGKAEQALRH